MPALQVKDFPGDLYLDLKACANAEDRSVSQQTLHILRQYLKAYRQLGGRTDWKVVPVELVPDEGKARSRTQEEERQERIEQRQKLPSSAFTSFRNSMFRTIFHLLPRSYAKCVKSATIRSRRNWRASDDRA